jgi:hypothetical protein
MKSKLKEKINLYFEPFLHTKVSSDRNIFQQLFCFLKIRKKLNFTGAVKAIYDKNIKRGRIRKNNFFMKMRCDVG